MSIKIETVKTENMSMKFFRFGRGKDTFVIIPGISVQSVMGSAEAIADDYKLLQEDFTIYVFDRREDFPPVYPVYEMARDTAEAIKALGLKDVCIFGASQGGMIGLTIAIEYPELVKKLAVGSTSSHVFPEQQEQLDKWTELAKNKDREGLYLAFGRALYPPEMYEKYRDLLIDASKDVTDRDLSRFAVLAEGVRGFNVTDRLSQIKCPVFAIGAYEDDVLDSDATMEIAVQLDRKPDFRLFMYKGYGHATYSLAPGYKERILEFLKEEE